jgi:MFS family permease
MTEASESATPPPARSLLDKTLRFIMILPGFGAQALLFGIFAADLPHISAHFGGGAEGDFIAGMATTSSALGLLLGGWVSGWLLERMGFRTFFAFALVAMGVLGSSAAFINDAPLLVTSRVLAGVAASFLTTACFALIPLLYEEKDRAGVIGFQTAFGGAASALCYIAAGVMIDAGDWRTPIYLYLPVFLSALALVPLLPKKQASGGATATAVRVEWRAILSHWRFFLLAAVLPILVFIGSVQLPLLLHLIGPMSSLQASMMLSSCSLLLTVGAYFYGPLAGRLGPDRLLQAGLGLVVLALITLGTLPGATAAVAGAALLGLGLGPIVPYLNDAAIKRNAKGGALVIGVFVTVASLGSFINPIVFSPLIDAAGLRGAFLIVAATLTFAIAVSFMAGAGKKHA